MKIKKMMALVTAAAMAFGLAGCGGGNTDVYKRQTIQWYLDNQEWWKNILSGEYSNYFDKMYGNRL